MEKEKAIKKESHSEKVISLMKKYGDTFSQKEKKDILLSVINNVLDDHCDDIGSPEDSLIPEEEDEMLEVLKEFILDNFDDETFTIVFGKALKDYDDYDLLEELQDRDSMELDSYVDEQIEEQKEEDKSEDANDTDIIDSSSMFIDSMPRRMEDLLPDELYRFLCEQFGITPYDKKQFSRKFKDFIVNVSTGLPYHDGINIIQDIRFRDAPKPPIRKIIIK